ncbi:MAG: hypothetical protein LBI48_05170 [Burkholderiaceae bacterium]|nr:hypothetical protein [Burkholderiaceae bacterium]
MAGDFLAEAMKVELIVRWIRQNFRVFLVTFFSLFLALGVGVAKFLLVEESDWSGLILPIFLGTFFLLLLGLGTWGVAKFLLVEASGWSRLMAKFPDRIEEPLLQLREQFGAMSGIRIDLALSVCPSGLRVGMGQLFRPFSARRNFFVPWETLSVTRKNVPFKNVLLEPAAVVLFGSTAELKFGRPLIGSLIIPARTADKLARAATARWPEAGSLPKEG